MQQIVIIGKTGAGKTAVGTRLAKHYGVPHISSGDIARRMADEDEHTATALKAGLLAPEDSMRAAIQSEMEVATLDKGGYVLEGFPRSVAQMIAVLAWSTKQPEFFLLDLPDLDAITRLLSRSREDDNPDSIARKLAGFEAETMPLVRMLDKANSLWTIDAASPLATVVRRIIHRIDRETQ